jgi:hypothetical protein
MSLVGVQGESEAEPEGICPLRKALYSYTTQSLKDREIDLKIWEMNSPRFSLRGSQDVDLVGLYALLSEDQLHFYSIAYLPF